MKLMLHCVPGLDLQDKVPTDGVLFNQVGSGAVGAVLASMVTVVAALARH